MLAEKCGGIPFFEVSAKTDINVNQAFETLTHKACGKYLDEIVVSKKRTGQMGHILPMYGERATAAAHPMTVFSPPLAQYTRHPAHLQAPTSPIYSPPYIQHQHAPLDSMATPVIVPARILLVGILHICILLYHILPICILPICILPNCNLRELAFTPPDCIYSLAHNLLSYF